MMDPATESRVREMEEMIGKGQFSEMETVWAEAVKDAPMDAAPFLKLASDLVRASQGHKASVLLELLVDPLIASGRADAACDVVNVAAQIDPANSSLKDTAKRAYSARFEAIDGFEQVLAETEADKAHNAGAYVANLKELCSFRVGDFLYHDAGWGLGRVVALDLAKRQLTVDFEDDKGHVVDLHAATEYFRKLPDDHLLARKASNIGDVKVEAENNPSALIRCAMRSLDGRVTVRRLKDALVPDVIGKAAWTKWWGGVKSDMSTKGLIRVTGTAANAVVELLHIPTTLEEEYKSRLAACHTPVLFARVLMEYADRREDVPGKIAFLNEQLRAMFDLIQSGDAVNDGEKLLGKLTLDRVREAEPDVENMYALDIYAIAADSKRALDAVEKIGIPAFEKQFLEAVQEANKGWAAMYGEALLRNIPGSWTWIAGQLQDAGEDKVLHATCRLIADHAYKPRQVEITEPGPDGQPWTHTVAKTYPSQFLWLATQAVCEGDPKDFGLTGTSRSQIIGDVLRLGMDIFHRNERGDRSAKALVHEFRNTLAERNCRMVRTVLEESSQEDARHLMHAIQINRSLSEARVDSLTDIIVEKYPNLVKIAETESGDSEEFGDLLATPMGIQKKRQEREKIINQELPATQKAIGEALQLGDISENAELDAARAKEELLNSRLAELNRELTRAKVMQPSDIDATRVGFGTKVKVRNLGTRDEVTYTILGRWDVNMDRNIISEISAIARGLAGARKNDTRNVQTPDGVVSFEVLDIQLANFDN